MQRWKWPVRQFVKLRIYNAVTILALRCHSVTTTAILNAAITLSTDVGETFISDNVFVFVGFLMLSRNLLLPQTEYWINAFFVSRMSFTVRHISVSSASTSNWSFSPVINWNNFLKNGIFLTHSYPIGNMQLNYQLKF